MSSWYCRVHYASCVPSDVSDNLSTLQELLPIPDTGNNLVDLDEWLQEAYLQGLITESERKKFLLSITGLQA